MFFHHIMASVIVVCLGLAIDLPSVTTMTSSNLDYLLNLNLSEGLNKTSQLDSITSKVTPRVLSNNPEFYKQMGKTINIVIAPILLTLGGLGNPLCIIVLTRKQKQNPTAIYLCVLAAFDFLVLYSGLLRLFLKDAFGIDIRTYSSFNCKVHMFLTYTFMQISSYILVAVTVNRFTIMFNRTIFCKQKSISATRKEKHSIKSVFLIFSIITVIVSLVSCLIVI
jgi:hypothetical protein